MKYSIPDARILKFIRGPKVPKGWVHDGCTCSPDGYWFWPCNVHDRMASVSRKNWRAIMRTFRSGETHVGVWILDSVGEYENRVTELSLACREWEDHEELMAKYLKRNIRTVSLYYINKKDELCSRKFFNPHRLFGYRVASLYSWGTHRIFTKWAKVKG